VLSPKRSDTKAMVLRRQGTLNPRPQAVTDSLFLEGDFFDPRDLVQVKYEMLRRVRIDGQSVSHSVALFGFARPTFYRVQAVFDEEGLAGLAPKKRGPRGPHKLTPDVVNLIVQLHDEDRSLGASDLARQVETQLGVRLHPRSIQRALTHRPKGGI